MKRNKLFVIIFTTFFLLFFMGQISYGDSNANMDNKAYIIIVNKLTLVDIENMPNLNNLIDEGNIGLMNSRGISGYKGAESFVTINASAKTYANNESSQFHSLDDKYKKIYENRVGTLDKEYAIGNIQIGKLYNQNENNKYSPYLGILGDRLHEEGLKTAAFGNSDTDEETIRTSALIPMDSRGLIDYGNLDDIIVDNIEYPYGFKTDYERILKEISNIESRASLIVIDTGDLARLNTYSGFLSEDVFNYKRDLILKNIDEFIGDLFNTLNKEKSLLMILSPNSGEERIDGSRLSPIILWGDCVDKGTITSPTTNREGIVSNLDIAPTIVNFLNLSIENMLGNPIKGVQKEKTLNYIQSINGRINTTSKVRSKTLIIYGIISIIIILVIVFMFFLNIKIGNGIGELFKTLLLLLYGIPMIFILSSLFVIDSLIKFLISIIVIMGICIFLIKRHDKERAIYFMPFSYFIIIILDVLFNGAITRFSILSHDPIIGARYFGMGNEMVGIFLAATILISGLLFRKYKNKFVPISILLLSVLIVGHPKLGANVGGTIAILIAAIYFIFETIKKQLSLKNIILVIVVTGLVIITLGYIDISINPTPTHLGKALVSLNEKGVGVAQNIINRKLLMNIKLVGISIWTKVLFINIFVQVIVSYILEDKIKKLMSNGLGIGILSGIIGSLVGFLLNDSGIMLSAISMNLITIFLLFIIIDDEELYIK